MQLSRTLASVIVAACTALPVYAGDSGDTSFQDEVHKYLGRYEATYQRLFTAWQEACWEARAEASAPDRKVLDSRIAAEAALTAFTGSTENIGLSRSYLLRIRELPPVIGRELTRIAFLAAGSPMTVPDLVEKRIADDAAADDSSHGFGYTLDGRASTSAEIENILRTGRDLAQRRAAWDAAGAVGRAQRPLLVRLRWLRNESVRALGQRDYFAYRASEYGLSTAELTKRCEDIVRELRPLQAELHTWLRYELARRYAQPVPDLIPAHWLPDPGGSDWSDVVDARSASVGAVFAHETPQALVERAERFYVSLGFASLPPAFWERSTIGPVAGEPDFVGHSWFTVGHVDLELDVRARLGLAAGVSGWETAIGALGSAYCSLAVAQPGVPVVLRTGSNRLLRGAVGSLMALAASQPNCLRSCGFEGVESAPDPMQILLADALRYVTAVSWSAGTLLHFESDLYRGDMPPERWNARWWQLAAKYQGLAAPAPRDERWCDAATQRAIVEEPGRGYDRAIECVLCFQLHDHIARKILDSDPHDTDYWGRADVGNFVRSIVRLGATVDWRGKLREKTGFEISTRPMVDYFEPLRVWLEGQNKGRTGTLQGL